MTCLPWTSAGSTTATGAMFSATSWSTSVKFLFAPIQSVSLSLAFVEIRSVPQVRLSDRGGGHCRCDQKAASGTKSAWLISSGRLSSRSVRLAHRPTIAPSLYQIWPTAGTKFGFDLRCKSRFSNGFTASALNALPSSIVFRFAPARGRTAAGSYRSEMRHAAHSRRNGGLAVRKRCRLQAQPRPRQCNHRLTRKRRFPRSPRRGHGCTRSRLFRQLEHLHEGGRAPPVPPV
jgi:hypothetical protein